MSTVTVNTNVTLIGALGGSGGSWGSITGTINSQTDLINQIAAQAWAESNRIGYIL